MHGAIVRYATAAVILVGVGFFGVDQCVWAQDAYPSWFKSPPPAGQDLLWAVGYASGNGQIDEGMPEAKDDAYAALRRARRGIVLGEKLYENAPGFGASLEGESFVEMGLPDTLRAVSYVDSLNVAGMTLVLAAWSPEGTPSISAFQSESPFSDTPPSWVDNEGRGRQGVGHAVGIAPRYYNLENSWTEAEKEARRKLAFKAATKVRSLNKNADETQHSVQSMLTGVLLRHVQVQERWADDQYCYVLMKGVVEKVFTQ